MGGRLPAHRLREPAARRATDKRAHVFLRHGRGILRVRRGHAPRFAAFRQAFPGDGAQGARRPRRHRDAAVADRGVHAALPMRGRGARASCVLSPRAHRGRGRAQARHRRYGQLSPRLLAGADGDAEGALRPDHGRPADDRLPQHAVRHARACGSAGRRYPHQPDHAADALSAAPARALHLLAVLAGPSHRPLRLSARRL